MHGSGILSSANETLCRWCSELLIMCLCFVAADCCSHLLIDDFPLAAGGRDTSDHYHSVLSGPCTTLQLAAGGHVRGGPGRRSPCE